METKPAFLGAGISLELMGQVFLHIGWYCPSVSVVEHVNVHVNVLLELPVVAHLEELVVSPSRSLDGFFK